MSLVLHNPHSVLAALEKRPDAVIEVHTSPGLPSGAWQTVVDRAGKLNIPVVHEDASAQRRRRGSHQKDDGGTRQGGSYGRIKELPGVFLDQLFDRPAEMENSHGLWLALEHIQDPHNVGAIFRTAAFFGVRGVVLTKDRSAALTATVYDVASGGLEYVPFAIETNLVRTLDVAKQQGLWILGASEHAPQDVSAIAHDRPWLLVVGNEEHGLRRLTQESCDEMCRLTPRGPLTSLNVSVATGCLIAALTE